MSGGCSDGFMVGFGNVNGVLVVHPVSTKKPTCEGRRLPRFSSSGKGVEEVSQLPVTSGKDEFSPDGSGERFCTCLWRKLVGDALEYHPCDNEDSRVCAGCDDYVRFRR